MWELIVVTTTVYSDLSTLFVDLYAVVWKGLAGMAVSTGNSHSSRALSNNARSKTQVAKM